MRAPGDAGPHLPVLLLLLLASAAQATELRLHVRMEPRNDRVIAVVSPPAFVDKELRKRLASGLSNRLVFRAQLQPEGFGGPLYETEREVRVVYDLWEEKYQIETRGGGETRHLHLQDLNAVEHWLQRQTRIELGSVSACPVGQRYRIDVRLAINPISQQVRQRSREMITGDPGDRSAGSRSLFGSVARVFLNVSSDQGVRELRGLSRYRVVHAPRGRP